MIIAKEKSSIIVIHNRHHAFLASQIANILRPNIKIYVRNWLEHLIAIASHDDSYQLSEARFYLDDKGRPKDFKNVELEPKETINFLKNLELKSQWIYLMSLCHLYERYQKQKSKASKEILTFLKAEKIKVCKHLKITIKTAQQGHQILKWADNFSMTLCRNLVNKDRILHYLPDLPGEVLSKIDIKDKNITIQPEIIEKEFQRFSVEYKRIPNRAYKNDADIFKTLAETKPEYKEWIISTSRYNPTHRLITNNL
ncbi:DUF3891 family protein [Aquimarina sp. ERC-38]|uniref:DUF3891 family protein n=1 Tax=Aquimarina sp. ERC-38 TaxID=2949996 RepID=UPI0022457947|nr:DUF3891 family protein [Aquimarina sp. ERC-38]UZO80096.1 DUF3891 family protein [Aquimarina sp. ERC-38]